MNKELLPKLEIICIKFLLSVILFLGIMIAFILIFLSLPADLFNGNNEIAGIVFYGGIITAFLGVMYSLVKTNRLND